MIFDGTHKSPNLAFAVMSALEEEEENLLPFGYEWYCVVLYLVLGLGLQYLLYFVLYT